MYKIIQLAVSIFVFITSKVISDPIPLAAQASVVIDDVAFHKLGTYSEYYTFFEI